MKQACSIKYALLTRYLLISVFIVYVSASCNNIKIKELPTQFSRIDSPQVSWNILFKPGTDSLARDTAINSILDSIKNYYIVYDKKNNKDYVPQFNSIVWCPCDPLLYNISFSVINGSGQSVITAPPSKKTVAGSGGLVANISDNIPINESNRRNEGKRSKTTLRNLGVDSSKILAIIDSGIDTTLFSGEIKNLIWSDRFASTIYNFLPLQPLQDFSDKTGEKHGSAVTAVALKAIEKALRYPKIMILKALNEKNQGSIFSVSCALSYAIQKKADVINLSLGYYGAADSILHHYLELCNSSHPVIEVFAAAGNTAGAHNPSDLCNANSSGNNLLAVGKPMFYPGCFTTEFNNMISVTQISRPNKPCNYQNYSNQLVSLGILDKKNCCAIKVDFADSNNSLYEGSSFATPVASGLKMMTILKGGNPATANTIWKSLIDFAPPGNVTIKGKYIRYAP
ncbi:MAG: S8/S53 family peptidase [Ginsengibacter sp.]